MKKLIEHYNSKPAVFIERTSKNSYCTTYGCYKTFRSLKEIRLWAKTQGGVDVIVHDLYKERQAAMKGV